MRRPVPRLRTPAAAAAALAAVALAGCGTSAEDEARQQVCDARSDIARQVDDPRNAVVQTAAKNVPALTVAERHPHRAAMDVAVVGIQKQPFDRPTERSVDAVLIASGRDLDGSKPIPRRRRRRRRADHRGGGDHQNCIVSHWYRFLCCPAR